MRNITWAIVPVGALLAVIGGAFTPSGGWASRTRLNYTRQPVRSRLDRPLYIADPIYNLDIDDIEIPEERPETKTDLSSSSDDVLKPTSSSAPTPSSRSPRPASPTSPPSNPPPSAPPPSAQPPFSSPPSGRTGRKEARLEKLEKDIKSTKVEKQKLQQRYDDIDKDIELKKKKLKQLEAKVSRKAARTRGNPRASGVSVGLGGPTSLLVGSVVALAAGRALLSDRDGLKTRAIGNRAKTAKELVSKPVSKPVSKAISKSVAKQEREKKPLSLPVVKRERAPPTPPKGAERSKELASKPVSKTGSMSAAKREKEKKPFATPVAERERAPPTKSQSKETPQNAGTPTVGNIVSNLLSFRCRLFLNVTGSPLFPTLFKPDNLRNCHF